MKGLNEFSIEIFEANKLKGFDVSKQNIGQTLMLVVSELSEALEADRKDKHAFQLFKNGNVLGEEPLLLSDLKALNTGSYYWKSLFEKHVKDSFEDEIADALIRLFDLCGGFGIDIEKHIELKRRYNSLREYKHGKKY